MLLARGSRDYSAVSISRTATGTVAIDVTVRTGEHEDVATIADAEATAAAVFERLSERFAEPNGHDVGEVTLTRNAKGETQITVAGKTTAKGLTTLDDLERHVRKVYDGTRGKYPMADGHSAKPGSVA
jgi:hypothetical protein